MIPLLLHALVLLQTSAIESRDFARTVSVARQSRTYLVHVPPTYDGTRPYPVVLAYHGAGINGRRMVRFCGLNQKADSAGFIAVYPNGTGLLQEALTWNGGNCCGSAARYDVDDVAFTRALLDDIDSVLKVDAKRIYVTGMSNGAIMAYRLASELSDRVAAIAPVGGPMGTESCNPSRPVPVIHFHGTDDKFAPFDGAVGEKSLTGAVFYSVDHSIQAWVKANGCREQPLIEELPDIAHDGTQVVRQTYRGGNDGSEVVLIKIDGGGHTWPGRQPPLAFLGRSTKNISANDLMWEFFQKHPRK